MTAAVRRSITRTAFGCSFMPQWARSFRSSPIACQTDAIPSASGRASNRSGEVRRVVGPVLAREHRAGRGPADGLAHLPVEPALCRAPEAEDEQVHEPLAPELDRLEQEPVVELVPHERPLPPEQVAVEERFLVRERCEPANPFDQRDQGRQVGGDLALDLVEAGEEEVGGEERLGRAGRAGRPTRTGPGCSRTA